MYLILLLTQCGQKKNTPEVYTPPKTTNLSGKQLAQTIYLNDGKIILRTNIFIPCTEAAKVMAADFDLDGDMNIMIESFYKKIYTESQKKRSLRV